MGCISSMMNNDVTKASRSLTMSTKNTNTQLGLTPVELSGCLKQFMTIEERTQLLASDQLYITSKLLLNPPFTTLSAFNDQLFITGYGGLTVDMLINKRIKALVNVSEEIYLDITSAKDSLLHFRYPLRENYSFAVEDYFDKVADKINELIELNEGGVIVFCIAGFSRSATMVLAYAIKYLNLSLKQAFAQLQQARPYARPNLIFMEKLVSFEVSCLGSASITMSTITVDLTNNENVQESSENSDKMVQVKVPSIYKKEYPHLYSLEESEAHRNWEILQYHASQKGNRTQSGLVKVLVKNSLSGLIVDSSLLDETTNELKPFIVELTNYRRFVKEVLKARDKPSISSTTSISSEKKPKTLTTNKAASPLGVKTKRLKKMDSKRKTKSENTITNAFHKHKSKYKDLKDKKSKKSLQKKKEKEKEEEKEKDKENKKIRKKLQIPKKLSTRPEVIDINSGYTSGVSSSPIVTPEQLISLVESKMDQTKKKPVEEKSSSYPKGVVPSNLSNQPKGSSMVTVVGTNLVHASNQSPRKD